MDSAIGLFTDMPTKQPAAAKEEIGLLDNARHAKASAAAVVIVSDFSSASTCAGPTSHSAFFSKGAGIPFQCQLHSNDATESGVVVLAEGNASNAEAQVADLSDRSSSFFVSGNMSVDSCSTSTNKSILEGSPIVPFDGYARHIIHGQRSAALTALVPETEVNQASRVIELSCRGGGKTCQVNMAKSQAYLPTKYDTKDLPSLSRHSSTQKLLQPVHVHTMDCEHCIGYITDSARSTAEKRKVMCSSAEEARRSASSSSTSRRSSLCIKSIEQPWRRVMKRRRKKNVCLHPSKTSRLSNSQEQLRKTVPLCVSPAKRRASSSLKPGSLCLNGSFEGAAILGCQRSSEPALFNLETRSSSFPSNFQTLAVGTDTVRIYQRLGSPYMAAQSNAVQLQGYNQPGFSSKFPVLRQPCSATRRIKSNALRANKLRHESCTGRLTTAERARRRSQKEQGSHSIYPIEFAPRRTNFRKLSRQCKAYQARQQMRVCLESWLAFCRKRRELRLQQELQHLRSLKTTAMNCLLQWASVFVAVGARRIFLSLRGFRAFVVVASHRHQSLHAATQVHERNTKRKALLYWRQEAAKYCRLERARRCLETASLLRLHHRYWSAWVQLLSHRDRIRWALFITMKAADSAKRALIADAFYVFRAAAMVATSRNECKLREALRDRTIRWIRHWRIVAHRAYLRRKLRVEASYRITWLVWQAWRHATAESAANTEQLLHNAGAFLEENSTGRCYLSFEAWRKYTALQISLKDRRRAFMLMRKRRIFGEMKHASEGSRLLREQADLRAAETLKRTFRWWLMHCRRRKRNDAVAQLLVAGGKRNFVHESFIAWADVTARWLAAKTLQRRSLQASHWAQWEKFVHSRKRRQARAEELVARSRTSCLGRCFSAWQMGARERVAAKRQTFTAWRQLVTYYSGLAKAKQVIGVSQSKSILRSTFLAWEMETRLRRHSRTLAKTMLCRRTIEAFKLFRRDAARIKHSRELLCARNQFETISIVFGAWKTLQWRLKELRQLHLQAMSTLRQHRIQPWWVVWRRRATTATSLRRWVAQAVGSPLRADIQPCLHNSQQSSTKAALAKENAVYRADVTPVCPLEHTTTDVGSPIGKPIGERRQAVSTGSAVFGYPSSKDASPTLQILQPQLPSTSANLSTSNLCTWIPQEMLTGKERRLLSGCSVPNIKGRIAGEGGTHSHSISTVELHSGSSTYSGKVSSRNSTPRQLSASGAPCSTSFEAAGGHSSASFQTQEKYKKKPLHYGGTHSSRALAKWSTLVQHKRSGRTTKHGQSQLPLRRKLNMRADHLLLLHWKRKLQQVIRMWMLLASENRKSRRFPCDNILKVPGRPVVDLLTAANDNAVA